MVPFKEFTKERWACSNDTLCLRLVEVMHHRLFGISWICDLPRGRSVMETPCFLQHGILQPKAHTEF